MTKRILLACLAALAFCAQADPITFFNTQFEIKAAATTSGGADSQTATASGSVSAASVGAADVATAGAFADVGLLTTSADASASAVGFAAASASSYFAASFLNTGPVILNIGFTPTDFEVGTGFAETLLFVTLISDGLTLFDDYLTGPRQFYYVAAQGSTSQLKLTLSSEANAGFVGGPGTGNAFSGGLVTFDGTVPLPATLLLVVAGLGALVTVRRNAPRGLAVG